MVLCNKIQEYCYDNQNLLKCFNKIILLFYKTEVLSEEVKAAEDMMEKVVAAVEILGEEENLELVGKYSAARRTVA